MAYIVKHGRSTKKFKTKKSALAFKKKYIEDIRYDYGKTPKVSVKKVK